jgi:hypothetical protein
MCCKEGHGHHHHRHEDRGRGESCECKAGCECGGGSQCGCGNSGFRRRYQTKGEQISELEGYLAELKAEVQAVEERLADLHKSS